MTLQEAMAAYNPQALMPQVGQWQGTPPYVQHPAMQPRQQSNMMNPLLALLMRLGGPGQQQQRTLASYSSNPYSGNNTFRGGY